MSTGKPSPGISKREEHANQLEYMFEKTYNHIQELCRLLALVSKLIIICDSFLMVGLKGEIKICVSFAKFRRRKH